MSQRWAQWKRLVLGSWLGLASCATPHLLFEYPRNLLADVWAESPPSAVYPPAV